MILAFWLTALRQPAAQARAQGEDTPALKVERLSPTQPGHCGNPLLSPNGQTVAFERLDEDSRGRQVLLLSLASGQETRVQPAESSGGSLLARFSQSNFPILRDFSWTPGGPFRAPHPFVVSASREDLGSALYLSGLGRLTEGTATEGSPTWSSDGLKLAFTSSLSGEGDLYLLSLSETPRRQVRLTMTDHEAELFPVFAPKADRLSFIRHTSTGDQLLLLEAPGKPQQKERVLSSSPGSHTRPSWSPDGKSLAYFYCPPGSETFDLYVLSPLTSGSPRRLISGVIPPDRHGAAWSPDGGSLIVVKNQAAQNDPLIRVWLDSGKSQTLQTQTLHNREPSLGVRDGRPYLVFTALGTREDVTERSWRRVYGAFLDP